MTNLNKIKLPRHRAYNWHLILRPHQRTMRLILLVLILGLILVAGEKYLDIHDNMELRISAAETQLATAHRLRHEMRAEFDYLQNLGAPGYVMTDWVEGTVDMPELRVGK